MEVTPRTFFILVAAFLVSVHGQSRAPRNSVCLLTPETGSCRAFLPSFYYNPNLGICDCFIYGGCNSGTPLNLFDSLQECTSACGVNPKLQIITDDCRRLFPSKRPEGTQTQPPPPPPSSQGSSSGSDPRFNQTVIAQLQEIFSNLGQPQGSSSSGQGQQQQFGPTSQSQQFQTPQRVDSQQQQFQPQQQQFQPSSQQQQFQPSSQQQFQPQSTSQQQFQPQPSPQQQFLPQPPPQQPFQPQSSSQQQFQPQSTSQQQFQPIPQAPQSSSTGQSSGPVFPPPLPGVTPRPSASSIDAQRRQQAQLQETIRRQQEFERQQQIKQQMQLLEQQQKLQQQSSNQQQRSPVGPSSSSTSGFRPVSTSNFNNQGSSSGQLAIGQPVRITG